jgi:hypothetical protein
MIGGLDAADVDDLRRRQDHAGGRNGMVVHVCKLAMRRISR